MSYTDYYIYGMTSRPFSIGCQPMEGLMASDAFNFLNIDIAKELYGYELEFIGIHREFETPQWI